MPDMTTSGSRWPLTAGNALLLRRECRCRPEVEQPTCPPGPVARQHGLLSKQLQTPVVNLLALARVLHSSSHQPFDLTDKKKGVGSNGVSSLIGIIKVYMYIFMSNLARSLKYNPPRGVPPPNHDNSLHRNAVRASPVPRSRLCRGRVPPRRLHPKLPRRDLGEHRAARVPGVHLDGVVLDRLDGALAVHDVLHAQVAVAAALEHGAQLEGQRDRALRREEVEELHGVAADPAQEHGHPEALAGPRPRVGEDLRHGEHGFDAEADVAQERRVRVVDGPPRRQDEFADD